MAWDEAIDADEALAMKRHGEEHAAAVRGIDGMGLYCAFLSFAKIKSQPQVLWAAKHNLREIEAELRKGGRIDPTRVLLNERIAGPAAAHEVAALAQRKIEAAKLPRALRRDAVLCVEFMVSLPRRHRVDEGAFFAATLAWLEGRMGGSGNTLSATIHRDESNPHMHVLMLPLIDGRMRGSDAVGGPPQLPAFYREFYERVAGPAGLDECPRKLTKVEKSEAFGAVLDELRGRKDGCLSSQVWPLLRDLISKGPVPFAMALGIDVLQPDPAKHRHTRRGQPQGRVDGCRRPAHAVDFVFKGES